MSVCWEDDVAIIREDLRRIPPPYLLRKYDATEEDYESLADEDLRCELYDGVLIVHSPASLMHEECTSWLNALLRLFVCSRGLGRVFGPNAVMQLKHRRFCPDVSFLAAGHQDRVRRERVIGPMDLVIEIVSKSTREYDLDTKRKAYREGRVPEVWLLDPEVGEYHADVLQGETYASHTISQGRLASAVLPGFWIDVAWLTAEPLPNPLECLKLMQA